MSGHTPGPWEVGGRSGSNDRWEVAASGLRGLVADAFGEANARLIAAAPIMRAALGALAKGVERQIAFLKEIGFDGPLPLRCGARWDDPASYSYEGDYETDSRWTVPDRATLQQAVITVALAKAEGK